MTQEDLVRRAIAQADAAVQGTDDLDDVRWGMAFDAALDALNAEFGNPDYGNYN